MPSYVYWMTATATIQKCITSLRESKNVDGNCKNLQYEIKFVNLLKCIIVCMFDGALL